LPLGKSFKIAAYVDDLSVGLGASSDWDNLNKLLQVYKAASNAKINKRKTKVVPLIAIAKRIELREIEDFEKVEEEGILNILGYE
ncbi:21485_t:CDS:1, partial [Gigaspora margarita]